MQDIEKQTESENTTEMGELEMASRIKDDNYYQVSGWMLNRLGLKGNQLSVFAIIYGFTQDGENEFTGSLQYLCDFIGTSKPTVIKALKELVEKDFLIKREEYINSVQFNRYKVNLHVVNNFKQGSKETLPPSKKTLTGGSKESLLGGSKETLHNNNILNNNINNKLDNKGLNNNNDLTTKKSNLKIIRKETIPFGTTENVFLQQKEYDSLVDQFKENIVNRAIEILSNYIIAKPDYIYMNHFTAMNNWVINAAREAIIREKELEQREKRAIEIGRKQSLHELKSFYGQPANSEVFVGRNYNQEDIAKMNLFDDLDEVAAK